MDIEDVPFKVEQALKGVTSYQYTGDRLKVEATAYANTIFNYIYLQPRGVTTNVRGTYPYLRYTQTDALFVGLDAEISYTLTQRWLLNARTSLLSATDIRNSDYLVYIPSNRFDIGVRYQGLRHRFYVEPHLSAVAKQFRAPRVITAREFQEAIISGSDPLGGSTGNFDFMDAPAGYVLASVSAGYSWELQQSRLDLRIAIENVLNTSYREYTNRMRYYADDIGRNVSMSLKYIF
jgi:iron complex outermembrane receptor protein